LIDEVAALFALSLTNPRMPTLRLPTDGPRRFLLDQFHGLVLAATVQRANVYRASASEALRDGFRVGLRLALDDLMSAYRRPVGDAVHVRRIVALADHLTHEHSRALVRGRFRIGPAQKALNLYLKYLWSAGWIPMPPHCPFDAVVMGALPYRHRLSWTQLDTPEAYRALVSVARGVAGSVPLAEWELREYQRRAPAAKRDRGYY
jgi:hypothetical protein